MYLTEVGRLVIDRNCFCCAVEDATSYGDKQLKYCLPRNTHTHPRVDTGHTGSCRSPRTSNARLRQNCNQQISARLKGLCWPAKQAFFAVRSIWTLDWPRVGASQKLIPRERLTRQNRGGGKEERSFFSFFFPPSPPCLHLLHVPLGRVFGKKKRLLCRLGLCHCHGSLVHFFSNCQLCVLLRYGT